MSNVEYKPEQYTTEQVRQIFGPGSNSRAASELQRRNPTAYSEMKLCAVYRDNILPETTLAHSARLTKEQIEEHHERLKDTNQN